MSDIRPGMRVLVMRGVYGGSRGRVVSVTLAGSGDVAMVDVGGVRFAAYVSALEPIAEPPTLRDRVTVVLKAARAQRDREAELAETRGEEACCHEYAHALLEETIAALTQALEEGS